MKAWRLAYLDEDFGTRYAWAKTRKRAQVLATEIKLKYEAGGYVPEVLGPAPLWLPCRQERSGAMIDWLNANLTRPATPLDRCPLHPAATAHTANDDLDPTEEHPTEDLDDDWNDWDLA